jgi:hypothetical protein
MFIRNGKRFNIWASQTLDGVTYGNFNDLSVRAKLGITEIADPERKDERYYYVQEVDEAPYVINTPKPLADVATTIWRDIQAHRDRLSEAGCLVGTDWFHNDVKSRSQWERMVNRSAGMSDNDPYMVGGEQVMWKTMSKTFVPLTAGKIREVVAAFELQEATVFKVAETHRMIVMSKQTLEEMAAYNWNVDWPAVYEVAS